MIPKYKLFTGQEVKYAHLKRDGHLLICNKNELGSVSLITKRPTDLTEQLRFVPSLKNIWSRVPCGIQLAGELYYPGKPASYVKTAIKERDPALQFECFCTSHREDEALEVLDDTCALWGLQFVPFWTDFNVCDLQEQVYAGVLKDAEGFMFKNGNRLDWFKWKVTKTIDLIVRSTKDGRGKYLGLVGSLSCWVIAGDKEVHVANVSGMDDADRIYMSDEEDDLPGRVCEVKYDYIGAKGKLRFPRFVRWREDKPASACVVEQDPDLEEFHLS